MVGTARRDVSDAVLFRHRPIAGAALYFRRVVARKPAGLMFNAVCKIPMQFCILLLGVLIFVFYQFEHRRCFSIRLQPVSRRTRRRPKLRAYESEFQCGPRANAPATRRLAEGAAQRRSIRRRPPRSPPRRPRINTARQIRAEAAKALPAPNPAPTANDADYVFITFILHQLPHGVIGLLVAAFFAAALVVQSRRTQCARLDAPPLISTAISSNATPRDAALRRRPPNGSPPFGDGRHWLCPLRASGGKSDPGGEHSRLHFLRRDARLFVVAFFIRRVGGTAVFWAALAAQALVFVLYFKLTISYLWYPLIGCAACVLFSLVLQAVLGGEAKPSRAAPHERLRSFVSASSRADFSRNGFLLPKSRPRGGCKAKSAAKSFSSTTTATTTRAKRKPSCAIAKPMNRRSSTSPLKIKSSANFRRFISKKFPPAGRRKPRCNCRITSAIR